MRKIPEVGRPFVLGAQRLHWVSLVKGEKIRIKESKHDKMEWKIKTVVGHKLSELHHTKKENKSSFPPQGN